MKKLRPSRIIEGTVKNIIGKNTKSSTDRYNTCKTCPENVKGVCQVCYCVVKFKSKVLNEYCPMNKWNDTKVLKKVGIAIAIKNSEKASLSIDEANHNFIFDYGKIKKGSDTKLNLVITNDRGNYFPENQDLNMLQTWTPCSCTSSSKVPKEFKEGNSFDFDVAYDSSRLGIFSKKVEFSSNEIVFKITLKGEVE